MKNTFFLAAISLFWGSAAFAEVILACSFPTLPHVVMRFPDDLNKEKTMEVASRPAVSLIEGNGAGRMITANVDGYIFRFAPANSSLDVEKSGEVIASETGDCITIGGPENQSPLVIDKPALEQASSQDTVQNDAEEPAETASKGKWIVKESTSALDDSKTVVLSLSSDEPIRGRYGSPAPAMMLIRCKENTTSVYIVLNEFFLSDIEDFGRVAYRIDDQKAAVLQMSASTDNQALGLWDGYDAITFINQITFGNQIVMRATPYNESPIEFSFSLTGLRSVIGPLKEACGW